MEKKRYHNMSEENKKKLKEYQKNYREAKNMLHKCKRVSKSLLQIYIFFVLLLILKRIKWCFNNVIKTLCMAKWAIHESLLLLLKHHFILF